MKKIEDLSQKADELQQSGLTTGQIADELNISTETVVWLLTNKKPSPDGTVPKDISVNWSMLGQNATRLRCTAQILCDMVSEIAVTQKEYIDVVVGVSSSGVPVASFMAGEMESEFTVYYSKKSKIEADKVAAKGAFSRNFSEVRGKNVVIIDDVISTGGTLVDVIAQTRAAGGNPIAVAVLVDKVGFDEIDGVPIAAIMRITRLG
ncbi:orotate phosphoribosyltransferase-like protein [Methanimicrococcus blatticola]|uniref:Transcriptional regulator GfcR n=1 Tax=Methanimicrococcus blatticola TaxID=91560 RepID=A0A484F7A0_9EURY|nr:orotate phosphoribosyltransferase-like protein [Methanimicrococcus blatticola]MBZ3935166.1 orotate phosphoribosyltransferase-like protein [Methanimicrococcus blatticola]MCC2508737.1 orotate phosphoribosyltransferase-like protein [Methanimicrococcus blatticola]TDQ71228.1 orotate phosphoribosyltransferase [Methanimicrococcus blatticola]